MAGTQKKLSGFDSISSIGSLPVRGKFAASVLPTVVKYLLKLFAVSVLSVQVFPLGVIKSVTVVFLFFCFSEFRLLFPKFFPHYCNQGRNCSGCGGPAHDRRDKQCKAWGLQCRQCQRAFASRTLAPAEKRDAQLDREGLAILFGVTKFHKYVYGRDFEIQSDHMPLLGLMSEDKLISPLASARIQRWALTLSNYQYHLRYKQGVQNSNAVHSVDYRYQLLRRKFQFRLK